MTTWFTSDTHFGHTNIIGYCGRPFTKADGQPDVERMNEVLIERWNARVAPDDVVWHLGDFSFGGVDRVRSVKAWLNGHVHLVLGNHDRLTNTQYRSMGFEPHRSEKLWVDGMRIRMRHSPSGLDLERFDMGLVGHVHERWRERIVQGRRVINVGVDVRDFAPRTLDELLAGEPLVVRLQELGPLQPVGHP